MPGPLDWWNRIRRVVGPPGAPATRAAVPAAADAARRAELAVVFAHLDDLEDELSAAERECADEVAAIAEAAQRERELLFADASERAVEARATAATLTRAALDHDSERLRADAVSRADDLRRRAAPSTPALVADAVAEVRLFAEKSP